MKKVSWDEFYSSRMLWFVNRLIHVFGWEIVLEYDDKDQFVQAYPARTEHIGFSLEADWDARHEFLAQLDPTVGKLKTDVAELDAEDQANVARVNALTVEDEEG